MNMITTMLIKIIMLVVMITAMLYLIKSLGRSKLYTKYKDNTTAKLIIITILLFVILSYWVFDVITTFS